MQGNTTLTTLKFNGAGIGAVSATVLPKILKGNTTLTTLELRHNMIGDSGAAVLAEVLHGNTALTSLDLHGCGMGTEGMVALAKFFRGNSTLKTLDLGDNNINEEGAVALSEIFQHNTALTSLQLSTNHIGDIGAAALAALLRDSSEITALDLSRNRIGAVGAVALAEALRVNKKLSAINFSFNRINDKGIQALMNALKVNSTVTDLDLWNCYQFNLEYDEQITDRLESNRRGKLLPYAEPSLDLIFKQSPVLRAMDIPTSVRPMLAEQLPNEVRQIFGQEWKADFSAPLPPPITATTHTTATITTTSVTATVGAHSIATLPSEPASVLSSTIEATATADHIKALLTDRNPVIAVSRWIDGHENPAAALGWVNPANGYTLLHYAVEAQEGGVVRILLTRGIDLVHTDYNNETAAQLAQRLADSSSSQSVAAIAALLRKH